MMNDEIVKRLHRYTENCVAYKLDADFADAVQKAADAIEELVGFVQEAERDRDEYRERLDKANDAIEEMQKLIDGVCADNDSLCEKIAELRKTLETVQDAHNEGYDVGYWAGRRDYEPKWIPVTERLPEDDAHVLGWDGKRVRFVYVVTDLVFDAFAEKQGITHWMPLPEPPKEEI